LESNGWVTVEIYIVNGVVVENHSATLDGSNDLAMVGSQARNGVGMKATRVPN